MKESLYHATKLVNFKRCMNIDGRDVFLLLNEESTKVVKEVGVEEHIVLLHRYCAVGFIVSMD